MAIIAAFMVPHPPVIVSEVGRGDEKEISETIRAYETVGAKIASLAPDTIVISSPHAEAYADYFQVADGEVGIGSFAEFGAPNVSFRALYDRDLIKEISFEARQENFPAGTEGGKERYLDHGTMVPLYFINKHYTSYKLVRLGLSGLPLLSHYRFGQLIKKSVEKLGRKVVFVASGDLSHCQKADGPYGYKPEGPKYDEAIMRIMSSANFGELLSFDRHLLGEAEECGHRSFVIMAGALDRTSVDAKALSHEATFGVGYGICQFLVRGRDPSRAFGELYQSREALIVRQKIQHADSYVRLARLAIETYINTGRTISPDSTLPHELLTKKAGAFVSIHENEELRGCIGTMISQKKNIAEEIIANAISAATTDPRFEAVDAKELPYLDITVDVLTSPIPILSADDLDPKKYGVIVENGNRRGLLLPDLEGVDTVEEQLSIAKRKAGIDPDEDVQLYRFESVRHL